MKIARPLFLVLLGVACGVPAHTRAQPNPNGQIIVTSLADPYLVLIRDPVVQAELRLDVRQRQAICELTDELDGPLWILRNQSGEKASQQFQEMNSTAESRMEQILTAVQRKRLNQMRVSVFGLQSLMRDDVAQKLDLSPPQRAQIGQVLEEAAKPQEESTPQATNDQIPSTPSKFKESVNTPQTRIAAILSRQQLARLKDLLGPPVDATKLGYVAIRRLVNSGRWISVGRNCSARTTRSIRSFGRRTITPTSCSLPEPLKPPQAVPRAASTMSRASSMIRCRCVSSRKLSA